MRARGEAPLKSSWQLGGSRSAEVWETEAVPWGQTPEGPPPSSFPLRSWRYFISQMRDEASEAIPFSPRAGNQTPTSCDTGKRGDRAREGSTTGRETGAVVWSLKRDIRIEDLGEGREQDKVTGGEKRVDPKLLRCQSSGSPLPSRTDGGAGWYRRLSLSAARGPAGPLPGSERSPGQRKVLEEVPPSPAALCPQLEGPASAPRRPPARRRLSEHPRPRDRH